MEIARNVGVFGGTFDPVHWGHLVMAEMALDCAGLDCAIWVPTDRPPHKQHRSLSPFARRYEMVEAAIAHRPEFIASSVDASRSGTSYAIDTLGDLQAIYPNCTWHWIIGSDAFQYLPRWRDSNTLARSCCWWVAPRDRNAAISQCQSVELHFARQSVPLCWQILPMPVLDLSSSLIRRYCRQGRSIRYLVPEAIEAYIQVHRLYSDPN